MINRRRFLAAMAASPLVTAWPGLAFANAGIDARFVLLILRGALDGLAAVPATGDPDYAAARGDLALARQELLTLDSIFSLHPRLATFHRLFGKGEASVVHATCGPYRERSHFDGQDVLESGANAPTGRRDGWLGRAIGHLPGSVANDEAAVALARQMPLVLAGSDRATSWAPAATPPAGEGLLDNLADLYADDPLLADALQGAQAANAIVGDEAAAMRRGRGGDGYLATLAGAAGKFLTTSNGPRLATMDIGGWDTHAGQGRIDGRLANRLGTLDDVLDGLATSLAPVWDRTVIMVVTEFGRTVHVNGSGGTDHGTGGAAFLAGGAVAGGRVHADWPGLGRRDLLDARDLRPTIDLRSAFKSVLIAHLGIDEVAVEGDIFPASANARPLDGLTVA